MMGSGFKDWVVSRRKQGRKSVLNNILNKIVPQRGPEK